MVNPNRFYTYAYLREDKTPYYIGKGQRNRLYKKHQKGISVPRDKSRIIFLKQNLTEEDAFKHEIYMIAVFGRKDLGTGILHNRTDGGDGASGAIVGEETRRKMSKIHKGKSLAEEHKKKIGLANSGEKNAFYSMPFSKEHRKKISESNSGEKNGRAKIWKITFDDGRRIKLNTVKKWAEENGYNVAHISAVAYNKRNYHKDIIAVEILTK
jgi:uncharacterized protein YpmB